MAYTKKADEEGRAYFFKDKRGRIIAQSNGGPESQLRRKEYWERMSKNQPIWQSPAPEKRIDTTPDTGEIKQLPSGRVQRWEDL